MEFTGEEEAETAEARGGGGGGGGDHTKKVKMCKGCTLYSSLKKANSENPTCVGSSTTLDLAPGGKGEAVMTAIKTGLEFTKFKYICYGQSFYAVDHDEFPIDSQDKTARVPYCFGHQMLFNKMLSTSYVDYAPAPAHKAQDHEDVSPQPQRHGLPSIRTEELIDRFQAGVTSGFKLLRLKSCSGLTYYSSSQKAKSKNPTYIGYPFGFDIERSFEKSLGPTMFKYACIGTSFYLDNEDSSADSQDKTAKLPYCVGLETIIDLGPTPVELIIEHNRGRGPAPAPKAEDLGDATPQPYRNQPPNTRAEEFVDRFQKNASLVASGVAKNLNRVSEKVKEILDDILK